jgi:hypothetical protein
MLEGTISPLIRIMFDGATMTESISPQLLNPEFYQRAEATEGYLKLVEASLLIEAIASAPANAHILEIGSFKVLRVEVRHSSHQPCMRRNSPLPWMRS